jgi:hypothetical protein
MASLRIYSCPSFLLFHINLLLSIESTFQLLYTFPKEWLKVSLLSGMDDVSGTPVENNENSETEISVPENFFLILNGAKAIPLNKPVTSIGRGLDNTVIIDDMRISRYHLKISFISDHFVLHDLNSTGGTFINGQRVNQGLLYVGDLISLAGVDLAFIQDRHVAERGETYTNPVSPREYPTADFHPSMTDKDIKKP